QERRRQPCDRAHPPRCARARQPPARPRRRRRPGERSLAARLRRSDARALPGTLAALCPGHDGQRDRRQAGSLVGRDQSNVVPSPAPIASGGTLMRCWYTRWQMSNALEDGDLAERLTRGHAAGCASCQAYGQALGALHDKLARGAHAATVPVMPVRRARPWLIAAPLAVGAAAVAIAIGVSAGGSGGPPPSIASAPPIQISGPLVRVRSLADQVSQALAKTPLDTELDDLIHDGQRGLDAVLATGGLRRP